MSGLPSSIGKYTIHERLGRGGTAEVYLAHDATLDRLVAIKLLRELGHEELLKRFEREARAIARLTHPNIVTIYELGDHEGRPFIAMEYVAGESLAELTRRRAMLPLGYRLKLIEDLCAGLACAHRAGIVHRDVKPANLMVDTERVLKVLDFGIVRMAGPGLTQIGTLVGTVNYMSPEQVSAEAVDHRSDIFSVGTVFYELLSYRPAFSGTIAEVLSKIVHAEPVPLSQLCVDLDAELVAMVSRCLAKPPDARYQSLLALRADVERARQRLEGPDRGAALDSSYEETLILPTPTPLPRVSRPAGDDIEQVDHEVDTWLGDAAAHLDAGELAIASDLIRRASVRAPDLPRVLTLRSELERAVLDQERVEQRHRAVRASLDRAHAKLEDGAHQPALRAIAEALALDPRSAEAIEIRSRVEAAMAAARERAEALRAAEDAVRRARERFSTGDVSGALADLGTYSPPHAVVTQALQQLEAEVAERERRREQHALQYREEERHEREQQVTAVLAAAREAIGDERFDEAARLIEQVRGEAHASVVEALRRAISMGSERLRLARDAVQRARALAARADLVAALAVLARDGPDHPLVSRARRDIRRARIRQVRARAWDALRVRGASSARAAAGYTASSARAIAGALRRARLGTAQSAPDRRWLAIAGALVLLVVVAVVVASWPRRAQSLRPVTAAKSTTGSAAEERPADSGVRTPASSTAPPQAAPVPSENARNRETFSSAGVESEEKTSSADVESAQEDGNGASDRRASAPERDAILGLLDEYEGAYSSLNEPKIRELQPSFEGFPQIYGSGLRSVTLTILNPSIDVARSGRSAIVKCLLRYTYEWTRGGLPPRGSLSVTWRLKKTDDAWVIVD